MPSGAGETAGAAPGPARSGAPERVDVVIRGGWLVSLNPAREIYRDGLVAIRGSKIVAAGRLADLGARYRGDTEITATDNVILPGMVNGHRHILSGARGAAPEGLVTLDVLRAFYYPSFESLSEPDMHVYAMHHAAEMLRFGTTLFEEPGCTYLDAVLDGVASTGIRCRTGPWTWDHGGPSAATLPSTWLRMTHDQAVERLKDAVATVRALGNPRIRDAVTIEGVGTCSDELNVSAAALAAELDSLCVLHKATSEQEVELELDAYGHRPLEHMYRTGALNEHVLLNHMTSLEEFEVDMLADSGARVSCNPSSALRLCKGTTQTGKWPEILRAGVPVALGTDAENASNFHDLVRAMYLAAVLPRDARRDPTAVTVEQAVEMATLGGAVAMRWDDELGSIEPGKEADLVIFDTNSFDWRPLHNPLTNLVYGATAHSVDTVLVGGEILVRHKELTRLDGEKLRAEAAQVDRRVLRRIGARPSPAWPVIR
jgi:5-methylthioadenosine/S-adenosylhomocysteine deaminase